MKPRIFRRHGVWYCGMRGYGHTARGLDIFHAYVVWALHQ